jgi:hypothetical protein
MFVTRISRYIERSVLSAVSRNHGKSWNVLPVNTGAHVYFGFPQSVCFHQWVPLISILNTTTQKRKRCEEKLENRQTKQCSLAHQTASDRNVLS